MAYRAKFIPRDELEKLRLPIYGDTFDVLAKELDLAFANFKQTAEFKSLGLCSATNQGLHRALTGKRVCRLHGGHTPYPNRSSIMSDRTVGLQEVGTLIGNIVALLTTLIDEKESKRIKWMEELRAMAMTPKEVKGLAKPKKYKPLPDHIREQVCRAFGGSNLYFTIMVVAQ